MVKFLIIRFSSIGDIVLTSPVIRGLSTQVKDAEVHFLCKPAFTEILENSPYISKVHSYTEDYRATLNELSAENFDYIIDLHNNIRSKGIKRSLKRMYFTVDKINVKKWLYVNFKIDKLPDVHIVDRYMATSKLFDVKDDGQGLEYFVPADAIIDPASLGSGFQAPFLVLAVGAQHHTKKIPLKHISDILLKIEHPVILVGGLEDKQIGEDIKTALPKKNIFNACGLWSINQSASVISQAGCVLTGDTGMMHIAAAFKRKIITVWGNTTPRFGMSAYKPDPASHDFEITNLSCRPCSKLGKTACPKKHFKCMMEQSPEEIALAANRLLIEQ